LPSSTASSDLRRVLGRQLAHFVDNLERPVLKRHDRIDQLLHRVGPDRWAVAGANRRFADLIADLGKNLHALRHTLLHDFESLSGFV